MRQPVAAAARGAPAPGHGEGQTEERLQLLEQGLQLFELRFKYDYERGGIERCRSGIRLRFRIA